MELRNLQRSVIFLSLIFTPWLFGDSNNEIQSVKSEGIIAWDAPIKIDQKTIAGRYLTSADSCFRKYERFLQKRLKLFASEVDAEKAGYVRKPLAVLNAKKYADVCSGLYNYVWQSSCEKEFFEDIKDAETKGFVPIEKFDMNLLDTPVVGIERSKVYLTACDPGYECFLEQGRSSSDECNQMVSTSGKVQVFSKEADARKAGYVSEMEFYLSELDDRF